MLPPEFRPSRRRTSVRTNVTAPRKSTRLMREMFFSLTGILTVRITKTQDKTVKETWIKKAFRHPQTSFIQPPNTPPKPIPRPKHMFPKPCQRPRFRRGIMSVVTKVDIAVRPLHDVSPYPSAKMCYSPSIWMILSPIHLPATHARNHPP